MDRNKTKKGDEGDTGGDHSIIKRGARESMSVESTVELGGKTRNERVVIDELEKVIESEKEIEQELREIARIERIDKKREREREWKEKGSREWGSETSRDTVEVRSTMRKQIEIVIEKSETGREAENASECSHVYENETEGNNRGKR